MSVVNIAERAIGDGSPVLVIAEGGVNHNGDVGIALDLIDAATAAGADAIKFQAFVTDELVTAVAPKAAYQKETTHGSTSQREMLKALELSVGAHALLSRRCAERGILYLCTPYDEPSVDALDGLRVPAFKIASSDTTNIPFLRYVAERKRPVLLSTGMSTLEEVESAVAVLSETIPGNVVLLQCTSQYPAPIDEVNLAAIGVMRDRCGCPVGFSDHTPGIEVSAWAVAAGACVVEKHLTLDRTMAGPDHRASLEPAELQELVAAIRRVERALGDGLKRPMPSELLNRAVMQKSLVARRPIHAGEVITSAHLACKRPATGLPAAWFDRVVGRVAAVDIKADQTLTGDSIRWADLDV